MNWIKRLFRRTIILDVNLLPEEYQTGINHPEKREGINRYENDFKVNVILINGSAQNTGGNNNLTVRKL